MFKSYLIVSKLLKHFFVEFALGVVEEVVAVVIEKFQQIILVIASLVPELHVVVHESNGLVDNVLVF